jgi:hypothetical protein
VDDDPGLESGFALAPRTGVQILLGRSGLLNLGGRYSAVFSDVESRVGPLEGQAVSRSPTPSTSRRATPSCSSGPRYTRRMWLTLLSCSPKIDDPPPLSAGEGVFAEGCPSPGRSLARPIGVDATLPGQVAVGTRGDLLLANERAAFVITAPGDGPASTYYHYAGVVADAVAMAGCTPASDDGLDEVGLVLGSLALADFDQSVLRAFRGEQAEIVADGADGGPAIVRITGTDAPYWLVEYELIRSALASGGRPLSEPFGLELVVDYVLPPDSSVLHIEWTLRNPGSTQLDLLTAALLSFAPTYDVSSAGASAFAFGGLSLTAQIPWLSATDGAGALAYGVVDGNLGYTGIAGIDVAMDLEQALTRPVVLPPAGEDSRTTLLAVGPTDGPSATTPLTEADPDRLPGATAQIERVEGTVLDPTGSPVPGARIELVSDWQIVDLAHAGTDGRFVLGVPRFDLEPWTFSARATAPGRDPGELVPVEGTALELPIGLAGELAVEVTQDGAPTPARIVLVREDGARLDLWTRGSSNEAVPPGSWSYTVTRGFEIEPVTGQLEVPGALSVSLQAVVDTTGWRSLDTHVHSAHSPDSRIDPLEQVVHAAAHGLDVVLHTEHELITEQHSNPEAAGVAPFVVSMVGQEVTATVPEHMTLLPLVPDGTLRGGPIPWYQLDIAELFAAMRERSNGGITIFNHPGYMDLVGWDVLTASPTLQDPTLLGLAPDAQLWSWDFDGIEVMNGFSSPFAGGNHRFDHWMSLVNAGHPVTAVGCSDDHGGDEVGFPRTYVPSEGSFEEVHVIDALREGRAIVSAGAFARVDIEGRGPGELVAGTGSVELELAVTGARAIDVTDVLVFANCDEVARLQADDPDGLVKLAATLTVPVEGDTSLVVAAFGQDLLPLGLPQFDPSGVPRVLTNPIFVDSDGNGQFDAPGGRVCDYELP